MRQRLLVDDSVSAKGIILRRLNVLRYRSIAPVSLSCQSDRRRVVLVCVRTLSLSLPSTCLCVTIIGIRLTWTGNRRKATQNVTVTRVTNVNIPTETPLDRSIDLLSRRLGISLPSFGSHRIEIIAETRACIGARNKMEITINNRPRSTTYIEREREK